MFLIIINTLKIEKSVLVFVLSLRIHVCSTTIYLMFVYSYVVYTFILHM